MVTNLNNYGKQIRFMLSTDDPTEVEWQNGDLVFLMDQDKLYVFDADNSTFKEISMGGGGGGGGGSGYSLIGSGSYTYSGAAAVGLQIPVSYTGSIKYAYCVADGITGIAHSGCFVSIDDLEFNQFFAGGHIGLVTEVDNADAVVNYIKNDSNRISVNTFTLSRAANAYMIQPGTYNWYIYGEA